jgi:hypothetical protein
MILTIEDSDGPSSVEREEVRQALKAALRPTSTAPDALRARLIEAARARVDAERNAIAEAIAPRVGAPPALKARLIMQARASAARKRDAEAHRGALAARETRSPGAAAGIQAKPPRRTTWSTGRLVAGTLASSALVAAAVLGFVVVRPGDPPTTSPRQGVTLVATYAGSRIVAPIAPGKTADEPAPSVNDRGDTPARERRGDRGERFPYRDVAARQPDVPVTAPDNEAEAPSTPPPSAARPMVAVAPAGPAVEPRLWLDRARQAVEGGAPLQAIEAIRQCGPRCLTGALEEPSLALKIQALDASGNHAAAVALAEHFLDAYPDSRDASAVRAVLPPPSPSHGKGGIKDAVAIRDTHVAESGVQPAEMWAMTAPAVDEPAAHTMLVAHASVIKLFGAKGLLWSHRFVSILMDDVESVEDVGAGEVRVKAHLHSPDEAPARSGSALLVMRFDAAGRLLDVDPVQSGPRGAALDAGDAAHLDRLAP